uniref:TspO/MBR family protein n=1 Tax=viral metagenome TaxID=1070528 RepID=A0A6C0LD29_9ZZZZ
MNIVLYLSILIPVILLISINFYLKYNNILLEDDYSSDIPRESREYFILGIWTILIGFLGYSYYLMRNNISSVAIIIIIIYTLTYPFITLGKNRIEIESLNIIYILITYIIFLLVLSENSNAALYILPLLLWIVYIFIASNILE